MFHLQANIKYSPAETTEIYNYYSLFFCYHDTVNMAGTSRPLFTLHTCATPFYDLKNVARVHRMHVRPTVRKTIFH